MSAANQPHLVVDSLGLTLGKFSLCDINLCCQRGEYHILMGPSGSGKSTLIKCILGFYKLESGKIFLRGKDITGALPEHRKMGYLPQNYALFPHLNVEQNIRFGIDAQKMLAGEADALLNKLCSMLGIEKLRKRRVVNLSGGEKQKVALGRALGAQPETILLDEPFSSIDEGAKRRLWFELKNVIDEVGITAIHITHNLEEAETLGERLSVLIGGKLAQTGKREDIFERPKNENIASYLNYRNIFEGITRHHKDGALIKTSHFDVVLSREMPADEQVKVCVRAQDIKIVKEGVPIKDSLKRNVFSGTIAKLFPLSEYCLMWFKIDGSNKDFDLEIKVPHFIKERYDLHSGKVMGVAFWEPTIIVF